MSAPDQVFYEWLYTRLTGDTTIAADDCAVVRDDEAASAINTVPKIEYAPLRGPGSDEFFAGFDLTIHVARDRAFGLGATPLAEGLLHRLDDAMIARVLNVRPVLAGYATSAITMGSRRRTTVENPATITLRRDFSVTLIPGGTAVPLSGTDADLTAAGINARVTAWQIGGSVDLDREHTESQDTNFRYASSDPEAEGSLDAIPLSSSTPFPTPGSSISVTFQTESGVSWTDTIKVRSYRWLRQSDNGPQSLRVSFVITNYDSPFFGGVVA